MIIDLIIIAVVLLFTFIGYKQGLVKAAIKILSFIIAFVIAVSVYKTVANVIINKTTIDEKIEAKIIAKVIPDKVEEKIVILPNSLLEAGQNTVQEAAKAITEKIIGVIVFIILFFGIKIVLKFVTVLADLITKLPIIKQFDKTGGIIYGFIKGVFLVVLIFAVISLASPLLNEEYIATINYSFIGSYLYNNNYLIRFIK